MPDPDPDRTAPSAPPPQGTVARPADQPPHVVTDAGETAVSVPGFVIGRTLGRGGMGVVYEATEVVLNRTVALKMLLAGPFADPSQRARFLLEAESVAALEHPHIVRVFGFGEAGGHPYLTMEFAPGGTLADRLKRTGPPPATAAAELLAKLADAVAHAHSRGVVHRDIKPLNVLLAADGEPRLTDFGLAKVGRSDRHLSVSGQVLGTPAYMAPEQAAGKVHEVGTAADVYALGAVLYDVLTGRPPFAGDSQAVTLHKVLTEEPTRPRALSPSVPRDLETICLKCLEKDAAKRYPTAQAFADDLRRYLRGEPIAARPAGRLERGYKWVKRNKVVAGALAAVTLALVTGAGVSLAFGLEAQAQAEEAGRKKKDAEDAAEREEKEKRDAIGARNELKEKNAELSLTLAKALLGSITAQNSGAPLTPYEIEALWQVALLRRSEGAQFFIEEATRTPLACKQLECRAEYVLHAAYGLDITRRDAAVQLFLSRFQMPNLHEGQKRSLALSIARSSWKSPELISLAARGLIEALASTTNSSTRSDLAKEVSALAAQMDPTEGAKTCAVAARILTEVLTKEVNSGERVKLAEGLSALAARMEVTEGARLLTTAFAVAVAKERDLFSRESWTAGLLATAAKIDPAECARTLKTVIAEEKKADARAKLAVSLAATVYGRNSAEEAKASAVLVTAAARTFTELLANEKDSAARGELAGGLSALAARMPPPEGIRIFSAALANESDPFARTHFANGLATAARMDPVKGAKACAAAARTLGELLAKEKDSNAQGHLAESLAAVVEGMDSAKGAKVCAVAARTISTALAKETDSDARGQLVYGLSALAERMNLGEGEKVCAVAARTLSAALAKETNTDERANLANHLSMLADRMEPAEAARVLSVALANETSPGARETLVNSLTMSAEQMEPLEGARTLTEALANVKDSGIRASLAECLPRIAARLDPAEGAKVCTIAARALTESLDKEKDSHTRGDLAEGLSALAARMEPAEGAKVCTAAARVLTESLTKEKISEARASLAEGLAVLAARMDPAEGAKANSIAAHTLTEELTKSNVFSRGESWAEKVSELAARMVPAEGALVLSVALTKQTNSDARGRLAVGLAAVATRMAPAEGAKVCTDAARILTESLAKETELSYRWSLIAGLSATAARMDPTEGARVLNAARANATESGIRMRLVESLSEVAKRMTPADGARILTAALVNETDSKARAKLAEGLSAVAAWMDPTEGAAACVVAARALVDANQTDAMAESLTGWLLGRPVGARERSGRAIHLAAGAMATPHDLLTALPLFHPHFHHQPEPRPLPAQELVELLKHPFCVGEARRAVLDALAFTYRRPFRDQWDFVEYARTHQPQLDLLTPPKRIQP